MSALAWDGWTISAYEAYREVLAYAKLDPEASGDEQGALQLEPNMEPNTLVRKPSGNSLSLNLLE
jgi:hypothetical protein